MRSGRGRQLLRAGLGGLVVSGAVVVLVRAFAGIDGRAVLAAVGRAGALAPLALAPFLAAMALDAGGLRVVLGALGHPTRLSRLLPIRIATEALHLTAPAGFVVADSATVALLGAPSGVSVSEGAVLMVARKWLVMRAHAAYILVGAACGAPLLAAASARLTGGGWLPWAVGGSALVPLVLSVGVGAGFRGLPAVARAQSTLARLPWPALRARVARWRSPAVVLDAHMARVGSARSVTWLATASFLACWLLEALETAVILALVGGPLDIALALAVEVGLSLLRSAGNVAPAGLGVQDAGYATLLPAMGVPVETTAAFVLLKRGKEIVWIAVGYALLAAMRRGEVARPADERTLAKA